MLLDNSVLHLVLALVGIFGLSTFLTFAWTRLSARYSLVAIPNPRSSHEAPTPIGAGIALVMAFVSAPLWLVANGEISRSLAAAVSTGVVMACVGLADDYRSLRVSWRLLAQFAGAVFVVTLIGLPAGLLEYTGQPLLKWIFLLLVIVGIVWHVNLFNFMDGIDGLAGSHAVFVAGAAAFLSSLAGEAGFSVMLACLAAATFGFLFWNWPPAKVFMGDAGSWFLGFTLPVLALYSSAEDILSVWTWMILMATFVIDASVTLGVRIFDRQNVSQAHRSHAYQRSARRFHSHRFVTAGFIAINLSWLFPLAYASWLYPRQAPAIVVAAYIPLICLALLLGAGKREAVEN